jgi:minor curlin subunit
MNSPRPLGSLLPISSAVLLAGLNLAVAGDNKNNSGSYTDLSRYLIAPNRQIATIENSLTPAPAASAQIGNASTVNQIGASNSASVNLQGLSNVSSQTQIGAGNNSALTAAGDDNNLRSSQLGYNNSAAISVVGNSNNISSTQSGTNLNYSLTQVGNGRSLSVNQVGVGAK